MDRLSSFGRAGDTASLAHYDDPGRYWRRYSRRRRDVEYYRARAAGCPRVLEYGVGNGRVALPLARDGVHVTGVDLSQAMLADLTRRLEREPACVRGRVELVCGDMRRVRLAERFGLIIAPFNALLHLYSTRELEQFLARVREHLEPGGSFVFDVSVPSLADLGRDSGRAYRAASVSDPDTGQRFAYAERFAHDPDRQLLVVRAEYTPIGSKRRDLGFEVPLTQRQYYPQELEALLHYNGFQVELVADFGAETSAAIDSLVFVCRLDSAAGKARK